MPPHHTLLHPAFLQRIHRFAATKFEHHVIFNSVSSSWSETVQHHHSAFFCWKAHYMRNQTRWASMENRRRFRVLSSSSSPTQTMSPHRTLLHPAFLQRIHRFAATKFEHPVIFNSVSSSWSETIQYHHSAYYCWKAHYILHQPEWASIEDNRCFRSQHARFLHKMCQVGEQYWIHEAILLVLSDVKDYAGRHKILSPLRTVQDLFADVCKDPNLPPHIMQLLHKTIENVCGVEELRAIHVVRPSNRNTQGNRKREPDEDFMLCPPIAKSCSTQCDATFTVLCETMREKFGEEFLRTRLTQKDKPVYQTRNPGNTLLYHACRNSHSSGPLLKIVELMEEVLDDETITQQFKHNHPLLELSQNPSATEEEIFRIATMTFNKLGSDRWFQPWLRPLRNLCKHERAESLIRILFLAIRKSSSENEFSNFVASMNSVLFELVRELTKEQINSVLPVLLSESESVTGIKSVTDYLETKLSIGFRSLDSISSFNNFIALVLRAGEAKLLRKLIESARDDQSRSLFATACSSKHVSVLQRFLEITTQCDCDVDILKQQLLEKDASGAVALHSGIVNVSYDKNVTGESVLLSFLESLNDPAFARCAFEVKNSAGENLLYAHFKPLHTRRHYNDKICESKQQDLIEKSITRCLSIVANTGDRNFLRQVLSLPENSERTTILVLACEADCSFVLFSQILNSMQLVDDEEFLESQIELSHLADVLHPALEAASAKTIVSDIVDAINETKEFDLIKRHVLANQKQKVWKPLTDDEKRLWGKMMNSGRMVWETSVDDVKSVWRKWGDEKKVWRKWNDQKSGDDADKKPVWNVSGDVKSPKLGHEKRVWKSWNGEKESGGKMVWEMLADDKEKKPVGKTSTGDEVTAWRKWWDENRVGSWYNEKQGGDTDDNDNDGDDDDDDDDDDKSVWKTSTDEAKRRWRTQTRNKQTISTDSGERAESDETKEFSSKLEPRKPTEAKTSNNSPQAIQQLAIVGTAITTQALTTKSVNRIDEKQEKSKLEPQKSKERKAEGSQEDDKKTAWEKLGDEKWGVKKTVKTLTAGDRKAALDSLRDKVMKLHPRGETH